MTCCQIFGPCGGSATMGTMRGKAVVGGPSVYSLRLSPRRQSSRSICTFPSADADARRGAGPARVRPPVHGRSVLHLRSHLHIWSQCTDYALSECRVLCSRRLDFYSNDRLCGRPAAGDHSRSHATPLLVMGSVAEVASASRFQKCSGEDQDRLVVGQRLVISFS